jgi:hypothetical protein
MNEYLEQNEGRLINIQLLKRQELVVYFVMSNNQAKNKTNNWQFHIKQMFPNYQIDP